MGNAGSSKARKPEKEGKRASNDSADNRVGSGRRAGNGSNSVDIAEPQALVRAYPKHRTTNPFLIFFLRLRSKKPKEPVTAVARIAGRLWTRMSAEQRKKYIDLANAEKQRREERKRKRRAAASAR